MFTMTRNVVSSAHSAWRLTKSVREMSPPAVRLQYSPSPIPSFFNEHLHFREHLHRLVRVATSAALLAAS